MKNLPVLSLLFFLIFLQPLKNQAQIFDVNVEVNSSQISTSSGLDYLDQLAPLIQNYIRETSWTEDRYLENERIRVNVQIVLSAFENSRFAATLILQSERPIYGTMAVTPLVIISDNNWSFTFNRNQSLVNDEFQHDSITSILDFYMYMLLGFDYDSFSPMGGQEYYRKAQNVLEVAQSAGAAGWSSAGTSRRNRFYLVNLMLNPNLEEFRNAIYQYHRHGLDRFVQNPEQARVNALEAFEKIRMAQRLTTDTYPFDILFNTKYREFTAMFMDAEPQVRLQAYNILTELDTGHLSEYDKLQ